MLISMGWYKTFLHVQTMDLGHQMDRNVGAGRTKPHKSLKSNDSTYDGMRKVKLRLEHQYRVAV